MFDSFGRLGLSKTRRPRCVATRYRGVAARSVVVIGVVATSLAIAGCVGNTDPATKITNLSAQLNAHGHTDNGPATWWWRYSTSKATVDNGGGTETLHRGPASSGNDVNVAETVAGLAPNTTYYFRACGKDESSSQAQCGNVLSFKTLAGTSYAFDRHWTTLGGSFSSPSDIALDSGGNVYVSDAGLDRIEKYSSTGAFITKWGHQGYRPRASSITPGASGLTRRTICMWRTGPRTL